MDVWLEKAIDRLAAVNGADSSEYTLSDAEIQTLLDLARVAAHESGERINAPLVCYLVGVAHGRGRGSLDALADAAAGEPL